MFSSHRNLKRRTPAQGVDREEYIGHLVEEFYRTTNIEAQEQVTANLANFAYDPINWPYLLEADALNLFVGSLESPNQNLQLHAIAALCNICLDETASQFIGKHLRLLTARLTHTNYPEVVLNVLALFYQLLAAGRVDRGLLLIPSVLKAVRDWRQKANDHRIIYRHLSREAPIKQVQLIRRFTQQDLDQFAQFTRDYNHIHSQDTPVEKRRVHGALLNAVVAGIIGTRLPGPGTVVLEQTFRFVKPCLIDTDTVVSVRLLQARKISTVEYDCRQNDEIVFAGSAKLLTRCQRN
ncbi:hypothetical protein KR018_008870 [Drosophila ironensis]|nr:hypothetical protein KR018_008870 [Drosophila ironensis]